ncbi:MAG: LysM peptidoglycan-binding domain-containing protein [Ruminococcus sp.]|nr:LysM peptidoglycan-binding domain-containing protein [Ruminococcus sp.]
MNKELNLDELESVAGGMLGGSLTNYVTKQGDTLWSIAQWCGIDVKELFRMNRGVIEEWFKKMNPGKPVPADDQLINYLYVGMTLKVPSDGR